MFRLNSSEYRGLVEGVIQPIMLPAGNLVCVALENTNNLGTLADEVRFCVELVRPSLGASPLLVPLFEGSLPAFRSMGWVYGSGAFVAPSQRKLRTEQFISPAIGVNLAIAQVFLGDWELLNVRMTLVTSGVAGTRMIYLQLSDPQMNPFLYPAGNSQGASLTKNYRWDVRISPNWSIGTYLMAPLPAVQIHANLALGTVVDNLDAGDQLSACFIIVRPLV